MMRKNRSQTVRQRRQRTVRQALWGVGGIIGAVLAISFFLGEMGLLKYLAKQDQAKQLEQEIQAIEKTNTELRIEISRLQQDPARIEEVARERLGFVRKGETVYQVVEEAEKPK